MARARDPIRPEGFTTRRVTAMAFMLVMCGAMIWISLYFLTSRPLDEITPRGLPVWVLVGGGLIAAAGFIVMIVIAIVRAWRFEKTRRRETTSRSLPHE